MVKRTILHVLRNDHNRVALGDNTLEEDHIWVFKLTHDRCFSQEVDTCLLG